MEKTKTCSHRSSKLLKTSQNVKIHTFLFSKEEILTGEVYAICCFYCFECLLFLCANFIVYSFTIIYYNIITCTFPLLFCFFYLLPFSNPLSYYYLVISTFSLNNFILIYPMSIPVPFFVKFIRSADYASFYHYI